MQGLLLKVAAFGSLVISPYVPMIITIYWITSATFSIFQSLYLNTT